MPAQKRSSENLEEESQQRHHHHQNNHIQAAVEEDGEDSDGSPSSSGGDKSEFVMVRLSDIRKEVQCPICLGIIRKTRTVMECLHRFCRECIDKSMRLGNNECPACRTHCASRRSLRDDPNYDSLIAALYPDIDKYEEEELAFHEEERNRNKQIQASIAQTLKRQSEALGRRRTTAKATAAAFVRKSQGNYRNSHSRTRRSGRSLELQGSDDDETNGNDGANDSSSDEHIEVKPKRCRRWAGPRFSQPSAAAANADGGCDENDDLEVIRESTGASPGLIGNPEVLAWGKGGVRSHTRYGSVSGNNGKNARTTRLSKLVDYLKSLDENDQLDVHLTLIPLDKESIPSLQRPYLCCRPALSIRHLCQFVALQTAVQADDVQILMVKEPHYTNADQCGSLFNSSTSKDDLILKSLVSPSKAELQLLEEQETLAELQANCTSCKGQLVSSPRNRCVLADFDFVVSCNHQPLLPVLFSGSGISEEGR
ncbi:putative E3 ubiquitin-protein ligase RING1a isoform X2 [Telopea speciosissima]|uniref:putative E3 ubiquitin-protein ligase RING1a isoform X2 n=1 Tax=Telopea speciosissima TaxID=54955 RepID=UPI001CC744B6|nr:putative E3 ubiquitin-protein ligase RING1a isoform X2 [Telopea speciosissima]